MRSISKKKNIQKTQYDIIKMLSKEHNIKIGDLCKKVGISRGWIWEAGSKNKLQEKFLLDLNTIFKVDINLTLNIYNSLLSNGELWDNVKKNK